MVGISAGLNSTTAQSAASTRTQVTQFYKVNLVVALCNATGTLLATYGGGRVVQLLEQALQQLAAAATTSSSPQSYTINVKLESLLAAAAFAYLAWKEYIEAFGGKGNKHCADAAADDDDDDDKANKSSQSKSGLSYSIALPMTLNNLAGGVAGGVIGLSAWQATGYAFIVSFGSMALGHFLASQLVPRNRQSAASPRWCQQVAIGLYLLLCVQSLMDV